MSSVQSLKDSGLKATLPRRKILALFEAGKVPSPPATRIFMRRRRRDAEHGAIRASCASPQWPSTAGDAMDGQTQMRVLVVEDNRDAAEILRSLLEVCGFQVSVAHTSQEGITAARQQQPHVVLCDIGLPDGDGYTVGSVLRQSSYTIDSRLIAVTGHGEALDRCKA